MDFVPHFHREVVAFEAAARQAAGAAPLVPSCPGWSVSDLVLHLGSVHRGIAYIIEKRLQEPPDITKLAGSRTGGPDWPEPERAPNRDPVPPSLIEWFAEGASVLESLFRDSDAGDAVWTWSREQNIRFWLRMQTIEAAVHRWDAENAIGAPQPVDAGLAVDAIVQTFEVMAPARRSWKQAPPGSGEAFRIRQTDGGGSWTVRFDGDDVRITDDAGACDAELAGTASDLMLFLWRRIGADRLDDVTGDRDVLDRYFTLVPPV
jgi:uncharacterized protein (TIGR03083 family)